MHFLFNYTLVLRLFKVLSFVIFIFLLISCESEKSNSILVSDSGQTQGTYYHIKYMIEDGESLKKNIDSLLIVIDNSLSTYNPNSLISRINNGEIIATDLMLRTVFRTANEVYENTNGAFDCSITPLVNAWGFGFANKEKMDTARVIELLNLVDFKKIKLSNDTILMNKNMMLDFNSLAQGYTVDLIAHMFDSIGLDNYLIEVGGEIKSKGKNPDNNFWTIGVDRPNEIINPKDRFQFILNLFNNSLATSGNYRKFYQENGVKYSHVINPKTGFPSFNKLLSVTVIHESCMKADAYATAFMVMGLKKSKLYLDNNTDLEAYIVYRDTNGELKTFISENLQKRILN
jgi:thiamine biosynthesis lipoprotein